MNKLRKLYGLLCRLDAWPSLLRSRTAMAIEHLPMLRHVTPDVVIDVGANRGQFALAALGAGVSTVYAFEPLPSELAVLRRNLANDQRVQLFDSALAAEEGEAQFHLADRADSSSLMRLGVAQNVVFNVREIGSTTVTTRRLDQVLMPTQLHGTVLLKIDVQGAEALVISGATRLLDQIGYVYAEGSFVELYQGQVLAHELIALLNSLGFELRGVYNQTHSPDEGPVQADFLFRRSDAPGRRAGA